jgi:hypothetical protein
LLGTDWYINQLRYKVNESDPIDVIWAEDQIAGDKRNVVYYFPPSGVLDTAYTDLYDQMKNQAGSDDPNKMYRAQNGELYNYFPNNKFSVPVDKDFVRKNGTVQSKDSVVDAVKFTMDKGYMFKNDAAVLNIIAANRWRRPVYFTQPIQIGFDDYLRQDGLAYRLVPVANVKGRVNNDWMLDKVMNKFRYGRKADGVYYDEENRRHMTNIRFAHTTLARSLIAENRNEDAKKVLRHCDQKLPNSALPYAMASRSGNDHNEKSFYFAMAAVQAGDKELAKKVLRYIQKDCQQQIVYYASLGENEVGPIQQYEPEMAQQLKDIVEEELKKIGN